MSNAIQLNGFFLFHNVFTFSVTANTLAPIVERSISFEHSIHIAQSSFFPLASQSLYFSLTNQCGSNLHSDFLDFIFYFSKIKITHINILDIKLYNHIYHCNWCLSQCHKPVSQENKFLQVLSLDCNRYIFKI